MLKKLAINGGEKLRRRPYPEWPEFDERERQALEQVLRSGCWFAGMRGGDPGTRVAEFERKFADYHEAAHGIACANGSVAIEIALRAAGIGPGCEVICPALTFIATVGAVLQVGAVPVLVDVDAETYCVDAALVESAITERTRAVIPVHYAGHMCDMDAIMELAGRHNLVVVEDAAHAHGAVWRGRRAGSIGHFGAFSFQQSKTMTAGEGGIITTNDAALAELCIQYRSCGRKEGESWYVHYVTPLNYRMVEFEAAVLLAQLERLPEQLDARQHSAAYLNRKLGEVPGITPLRNDPRCETHGYYLYQFRYDPAQFQGVSRDLFVKALEAEGVPCHIGYPWPLSANPLFANEPRIRDLYFPVAERICAETVVIPHQVLLGSREDLHDVVAAVAKIQQNAGELAGHEPQRHQDTKIHKEGGA
jgi:dTDP-4-amino-4,6-dideoxygalactose transaminase